jgi:ATP-dependent RNA helicase DDX52/ROK1
LICTDLLGRGIDLKGVKLFINYDFLQSGMSYVLQIGQSGRAGKIGHAIAYFSENDLPFLKKL